MSDVVYSDMVKSLAKDGGLIVSELTPLKAHLLHMAVGVAGETGELLSALADNFLYHKEFDYENIKEELGDAEFYLEGLCQGFNVLRDMSAMSVPDMMMNQSLIAFGIKTSILGSDLLDAVKKGVIYNKDFDMYGITSIIAQIDVMLENIRTLTGFSKQEIFDHNVSKLSVRYNGLKYSDESAQNRADKQ